MIILSLYRRPDLFNFDDLETTSTHARLESSFKMAEKYFGVPRYLDSSGEFEAAANEWNVEKENCY